MNQPGVVLVGGPLDGLELDMPPGMWKVPIYDTFPTVADVPAPAGSVPVMEPANPAVDRPITWHVYMPEPYRTRNPAHRVRMLYQPRFNHKEISP